MPLRIYKPSNVGGLPAEFGNERSTHGFGSPFLENAGQAPTALGAEATVHLQRFIFNEIVGTDPEPYFASLKLFMFNGTPATSNSSVYTWLEKPSQRYAPTAQSVASAVTASSGGYSEYNIDVSDEDYAVIPLDNDIMFPGGLCGTIVAKTPAAPPTSAYITVRTHVSGTIPDVTVGMRLPLMGEIRADGMERIANVQRFETIERYNYVATFMRSERWDTKEALEYLHNQQTNYRQENRNELILNLRYDALVNMWAARKEMRRLSGGEYAKGFDGVFTQMVNGGSASATTTLGNLIATFEAMGHNTNYQSKGGTRFVIGRTELLTYISKEYKDLKTRYTPDSMTANLDLEAIKFGGMRYVLVPCEPWGDINYFQSDWASRLIVIDSGSIKTVQQKGLPMVDINNELLNNYLQSFRDSPRSLRDYKVWSAEINLGMKMIEPRGSYIINVI